MSRRLAVALTVALILTGGALAARWAHGVKVAADRCDAIRSRIAAAGDMEAGAGQPGVVVIGDSYAAGDGLADRRRSWAHLTAGRVSGIGGTGYLNEGPCGGHAFSSRIAAALATNPRVIIIEGGLNDTDLGPDNVWQAADDLLDIASGVPTVLLVGPPDVPAREHEAEIDRQLADVAQHRGRHYVSMLNVPLPLLPDHLHPTPEGHRMFSERVTAALASLR